MAGSTTRVNPRVLHVVRPSAGGIVSSLCTLLINNSGYTEVAASEETCARIASRWTGMSHVLPDNAFLIQHSLGTALQIRRLARTSKSDVIHGHGITVLPAIVIAGMLTGLPVVVTLHNIFKASTVQRLVLKLLCQRVHIITVSDAILRSVGVLGGLSAQRIYNGVAVRNTLLTKTDARKALGRIFEQGLVLSVARLSPEKGLSDLNAVARDIRASVVIVGDGPLRQTLAKSPDVEFVGHVDDPWVWYCAADVVVIPSLTEGLGLSAIEALSAGCPVVATNVGGLPEVISAENLGTRVGASDPDALKSAINHWLEAGRGSREDEESRRAYAADHFSVSRMASQTVALYRRIMRH